MKRAAVALLAVLAASCSSYAPEPILAGDVCFRCHRVISDTRVAGEIIDGTGHAFKFKTPLCMAKFIAQQSPDTKAVFVTDYRSGRIIKATAATYVPAMIGEGRDRAMDYMAFQSEATAQEWAQREKTKTVAWKDVLEAAKNQG